MNRTELTPDGLLDDLFIERARLEIKRSGDARYAFVATATDDKISVEIWTTQKARISVLIDDDAREHDWFTIRTDGELLEELIAIDCAVHFEQLDRRHFFLGLHRGTDEVRLRLHAPGYIKARPVEGST